MKKMAGTVNNGSTTQKYLESFLLRVGLAMVFLYAAVAATLDPPSWLGFFPRWISALLPVRPLLLLFSTYQFLLALWLLSGKKTQLAALLSGLTIGAIIITNIWHLDIVFRDVAILFAAAALWVLSREQRE